MFQGVLKHVDVKIETFDEQDWPLFCELEKWAFAACVYVFGVMMILFVLGWGLLLEQWIISSYWN